MYKALAAVFALVAAPHVLRATPVYVEGTYRPGDFVPSSSNLILNVAASVSVNGKAAQEGTSASPSVLTDGEITTASMGKRYTIGDGAKLTWTLAGLCTLRSVRIYTYWGDQNRNDIVVSAIKVVDSHGAETTLAGSAFGCSQTAALDTIHGDPDVAYVSGTDGLGRFVEFSDSSGLLANDVASFSIEFGTQDNGYGGYLEIEAIGESKGYERETEDPLTVGAAEGATFSMYGPYGVYTFSDPSTPGTFTVATSGTFDILLVGGGGAGGWTMGGGGGAGGFVYVENAYLPAGTYDVRVGAGGSAVENLTVGESNPGNPGGFSSLGLYMARGGGGGGSWSSTKGMSGASGGGAAKKNSGGDGIAGEGKAGGTASGNSVAGGGGAGEAGGAGGEKVPGQDYAQSGGKGGDGLPCSITGEEVWYAGGGGGGAGIVGSAGDPTGSLEGGKGGKGGGGEGASCGTQLAGSPGVDGLGGGGGGGGYGTNGGFATAGGKGGDGVVIVRVRSTDESAFVNPIVDISLASTTLTNASFVFQVFWAGTDTTKFNVTADFGAADGSFVRHETVFSDVAALGSATLTNLSPSTTYNARFVVTTDAGGVCTNDLVFTTGGEPLSFAGFVQYRYPSRWLPDFNLSDSEITPGVLLSAAAAHTSSATTWDAVATNGETVTTSWGNDKTFAYTGYMNVQEATYVFGAKMDDNVRLKIGDDTVIDQGGNTFSYVEWTPPDGPGWYPIDLRVGNGSGGYGPYGGFLGIAWNTTGYTIGDLTDNWHLFEDPGDGSLFVTTLGKMAEVNAAELSQIGVERTLRGVVAYGADLCGGAVKWAFSPTYGGNDPEGWSLSDGGTAEAGGSRTFSVAVPQDASFFRVAFVVDGKYYWTPTVSLADLPVRDGAAPQVLLRSVGTAPDGSVVLDVNVLSAGEGYSVCTVTATVTDLASGRAETFAFADVGVAETNLTIVGLAPNRTMSVTLVAENAGAATSEATAAQTFLVDAGALPAAGTAKPSLPGLWQAYLTGEQSGWEPAWNMEIEGLPDGYGQGLRMRDLAPTAFFYSTTHWRDPFENLEFAWPTYTTYGYEGFIRLEKGVTYKFLLGMDDYARLEIDGLQVMENPYGEFKGDYVCTWSGWHAIRLLGANAGGGGGRVGDIGAGISTDGGETFVRIVDDGYGDFLRVARPLRTIAVRSSGLVAGGYAATLDIGEPTEEGVSHELHAVYGPTCAGDDPAAWAHDEMVGTVAEADVTANYSGFPAGSGTVRYVRFYLKRSTGDIAWSEALFVPDGTLPLLSAALAVDATAGDSAVVSGYLTSAGAGASAAVSIEIGTDESLSDATEVSLGDVASGAPFSRAVAVQPGATYYVRAKAVATDEAIDMTPVLSFTVPAGAVVDRSLAASATLWNATFSGHLLDAGAGGSATLTLLTGASADALTNTAEVVMTSPGAFAFPVEFPFLNETVYAKVVASNSCGAVFWTDATSVASVELADTAVYTWNPEKTSGAWGDPSSWISSIDDPRCAYPNSYLSTVFFAGAPDEVTVSVDGSYRARAVRLTNGAGGAITFAGTGKAASRIDTMANETTMSGARSVTFDAVYAYFVTQLAPDAGAGVVLRNGAEVRTHYGLHLNTAGSWAEVSGKSVFFVTDWQVQVDGAGARLVVDDSSVGCEKQTMTLGKGLSEGDAAPEVVLRGAAPEMFFRGVDCTSGGKGVFRFVVPLGGYDGWVLRSAYWNIDADLYFGGSPTFVVDRASPFFSAPRGTAPLVWWSRRIDPAAFGAVATTAKPGSSLVYRWGSGHTTDPADYSESGEGNPLTVWLDYRNVGFSVFVR